MTRNVLPLIILITTKTFISFVSSVKKQFCWKERKNGQWKLGKCRENKTERIISFISHYVYLPDESD